MNLEVTINLNILTNIIHVNIINFSALFDVIVPNVIVPVICCDNGDLLIQSVETNLLVQSVETHFSFNSFYSERFKIYMVTFLLNR